MQSTQIDTALHPHSALAQAAGQIATQGFAFVQGLDAADALGLGSVDAADTAAFLASWQRLELDTFLADGGKYRLRRHDSLIQSFDPPALAPVPYRPHWQPKQYNTLHGGVFRTFAQIEPAVLGGATMQRIISALGELFATLMQTPRWHVEAHQFRLDARGGQALPTPEGAHRDGVDYVALVMIERADVSGAVTTIYSASGQEIGRTTLTTRWSLMLLDDARVTHATTAIAASGPRAWRDTLVITYRKDGFLQPKA
jgi:hypothetical protein